MTRRSRRLPADLSPNRLTEAVAARRRGRLPLIDLTASNPTRAGFDYPADLLAPLGHPRGLGYSPEPFGVMAARQAVADDYARRGVHIAPERVALTASTSEAYSLLFKLLCDPGDQVLVPAPSYPLFEHLTALESVEAVPYPLDEQAGWRLDLAAMAAAIGPRTAAVLVVSPNNPTGSMLDGAELDGLASLAESAGVALIGDEVFADYPLGHTAPAVSVLQQDRALAFGLGGLSKSIGLPQVKAAWIAASGPADAVASALHGLEIVTDTFLSVSTPVQLALAELLQSGATVRDQILARVTRNLGALRAAVPADAAVTVQVPSGGWSAVLRVPGIHGEEALAVTLVEEDGVLVHPGYFFDFPHEAFVIVSLLPEPPLFDDAVAALLRRVAVPT